MIHSIVKKVSQIFHSVIARFSPENRGNPVYALSLTRLPRRFAPRNDKLGKYVLVMTSWGKIS